MTEPSYLKLFRSGELEKRATLLEQRLGKCVICPRHCEANRLANEEGFCQSGHRPLVASHVAHFGEEPVLVGSHGSGNIFFGSCNLRCVYCQNWQISHTQKGERPGEVTFEQLANMMIALQNQGCHNINLVSPSHFVAQIMKALVLACEQGLRLPLVYNTNAYDDLETLKMLRGVIDIYLPDLKYANDQNALKYSQAQNYQALSRQAIQEMFNQVGLLKLDEQGLSQRGLIVRHLVLPNGLADSRESLTWIAQNLSPQVNISIMSQYYPTNLATRVPLLSRKIRENEYWEVLDLLEELKMENGFLQEFESAETYRPDFKREEPFDNRELNIFKDPSTKYLLA